jgi:hypothetical protein
MVLLTMYGRVQLSPPVITGVIIMAKAAPGNIFKEAELLRKIIQIRQ